MSLDTDDSVSMASGTPAMGIRDGATIPGQVQVDRENRDSERRPKPRVSIACTVCRAQHLRCDAALPICSRCQSLNKKCTYTNLRRSRRKQLDHGGFRMPTSRSPEEAVPVNSFAGCVSAPAPSRRPETSNLGSSYALAMESLQQTTSSGANTLATSTAIDGFYAYFFNAHPFILPRSYLIRQSERDSTSVASLVSVMTLIGSLYIHDNRLDIYRQDTERQLQGQSPSHGFNVQALMLFALTLEWSGEAERADTILERAKSMALAIGLNRQSFAEQNGQGNPVLEESWRRTWWELYVIDGLFAGVRHRPTFSSWTVDTDVDLPGEEKSYTNSNILPPQTLRKYDNRGFDDNEMQFSSFAYLIDAIRILGTVLAAGDFAGGSPSSLVKNAEANIMSWDLHLPSHKQDPVCVDGTVDEVLFRAHMVIRTAATHLHRPRSRLHYSTMELLCSKYAPPLPAEVLSPEEKHYDRHTHAATNAAKTFVGLLTFPTSPISHSPFIMCMGSMAIATHMSGCEYLLRGSEYAYAKDRVRMFLGVLGAFKKIWPQASKWSSEITLMAKAVFEDRDADGNLIMDSNGTMNQVGEQNFTVSLVGDQRIAPPNSSLDTLLEDVPLDNN